MNNAESAATALRALGGKLSPEHDRLWLIPEGTIRAAKQIARENQYLAAFKIEKKVTAEMAKHGWKIAPNGNVDAEKAIKPSQKSEVKCQKRKKKI